MQDIGGMYTRIEADTTGLAKAETDITSFAKKAAGLFAGAFAVDKIKSMIETVTMATARYDTLGVVMDTVGKNAGYTAAQMATFQTGLEKTGISMKSSRETLIKMTQANLDLAQSSKLARIAQDAAVIGNINSSEAFERMVYGIQSGQIEVLKTIGINVSFEASYQKLAATLHKTTNELTETEKAGARANAVIDKGKDIAGAYEAAMDTPMKQWLSMTRYVDNLEVALGRVFQPAFGTIVKTMTEGLKEFTASLDDTKIKKWGDNLNSALKFAIDFGKYVVEYGSDLVDLAGYIAAVTVAQYAWNTAIKANPVVQLTAAVVLLNNELKRVDLSVLNPTDKNLKNVDMSFGSLKTKYSDFINSVNAIIKGQKQIVDPDTGKVAQQILSDVDRIQGKIKELQNFKEPWSIFPDRNEVKQKADEIKTQISSLEYDLNAAKAKNLSSPSFVLFADPNKVAQQVNQAKTEFNKLNEAVTGVKGSWKSATMEVLTAQVQQDRAVAAGTQSQGRSLVELTAKYKEFANNVRNINNEIRQNQMTGDELVRSIQESGMTPVQKWFDMRKAADEYATAARKAMEEFNVLSKDTSKEGMVASSDKMKEFSEYVDKARQEYAKLGTAVKDANGDFVSQANAQKNAIEGVKEMTQLKQEALQADKQMNSAAANALVKEGGSAVGKLLEEIDTKSQDLVAQTFPKMGEAFDKVWKDGAESANTVFTNIDQSVTATAQKINDTLWAVPKNDYVSGLVGNIDNIGKAYIEASAKGTRSAQESADLQIQFVKPIADRVKDLGMSWDDIWQEAERAAARATDSMIQQLQRVQAAAAAIQVNSSGSVGYSVGGAIQYMAKGGQAIMAAAGQYFPGYGGGDKIPIMGEAGEVMIRKESVKGAGLDTALAFNDGNWGKVIGNLARKMSTGGPVSPVFPKCAMATGGPVIPQQSIPTNSDQVHKYYIQGQPEPITVRTDKENAFRLKTELERQNRRRS